MLKTVRVAATVVLLAGCLPAQPGVPELRSVSPRLGAAQSAVTLTIEGSGFLPALRADLERNAVLASLGFEVVLRGPQTIAIDLVRYLGPTRLETEVPVGLPLGRYSVTVVGPFGASVPLAEAFEVCQFVVSARCERDRDNDGVFDSQDPAPDDPTVCGDSDADGCDECGPVPPDADSDGFCPPVDCNDQATWIIPGPGLDLCDGDWLGLRGSDLAPSATWTSFGSNVGEGVSFSANGASEPALVLDEVGNPMVVFVESRLAKPEVYGKRLAQGRWVELGPGSTVGGGISLAGETSASPTLARDVTGAPLLAWSVTHGELCSDADIYVRALGPTGWIEAPAGAAQGGGVSGDCASATPALAVSAAGIRALAYSRWSQGNWEIFVQRSDGGPWQPYGTGAASGSGVSNTPFASLVPKIAVNAAGTPFVAWQEHVSSCDKVVVRSFDGAVWREVGSAEDGIHSDCGASAPALAIDPATGQPVVAWEHRANGGNAEIYLAAFDGTAWVEQDGSAQGGGVSNDSGDSSNPALAIDRHSNVTLAWRDVDLGTATIAVKRHSLPGWASLGSPHSGLGPVDLTVSAITLTEDAEGVPTIAWQGSMPGQKSQIYLARFIDNAWQSIEPATAQGGALSNAGGRAQAPALTQTRQGLPVAAWEVWPAGASQSAFAQTTAFDGSAFVPLGAVAASGATSPFVVVDDADQLWAVWADSKTGKVHVKKRTANAWEWVGDAALGLNAQGCAQAPTLSVQDGVPTVAWAQCTTCADFSTCSLAVASQDGALFVPRQDGLDSEAQNGPPRLVKSANEIWLAKPRADSTTGGDQIALYSWAAGAWTSRGVLSRGEARIGSYALAAADAGACLVAWSDNSSGRPQVYARRYAADGFTALGLASGAGLSASARAAHSVSAAWCQSGRAVVAWIDDGEVTPQVMVKTFDGQAWQPLGPGNANVSRTTAPTTSPMLSSQNGVICVAWQERVPAPTGETERSEVVLRCANDPAP